MLVERDADSAELSVDKGFYHAGDTVTVHGSGFAADAGITITISDPEGVRLPDGERDADDHGSFDASIVADPDGNLDTHIVEASDGDSSASASYQVTRSDDPTTDPPTGDVLRTYRLALITDPGYATFFGGPANVTAAKVALINRVDQVYQDDLGGNAEVSWTSGGRRLTALVPHAGRMVAGGKLAGADVSEAVAGSQIPFQRVIRAAPGGWYYALQSWQVKPRGPVELRFSRWQGVPTEVSLTASETVTGVRLVGRATLAGKPVRAMPRPRVYVDSLVGQTWGRLGDAPLGLTGSYMWAVPKARLGDSYRAIVAGPNVGAEYAPDASSVAPAPVELDPGR